MKKKWTFPPQEMWDPCAIERWLEDEAAKGWRLKKIGGWRAVFEKTEPRKSRVRVQYCGPMEKEAWKERIAHYEKMGWHLAEVLGQYYEVFYCDDPKAKEPDTDPEVYAMAWKEPLRHSWWGGLGLTAMGLAMLLLVIFMEGSVLSVLLSAPLRALYTLFILSPLLVLMGLRQMRRIGRARKMLEAGMKPEGGGDWKASRRWWSVCCVAFLAFWLVVYMGDIWFWNDVDTAGLPHLQPDSLEEEITEEDWQFSVNGYARKATPLRPVWYDTQYCTEEQQVVINSRNRLQFAFLAKMLYREKLNDFYKDWPDAVTERMENGAFDEAVLLKGGENTQMLLVRRGRAVYYLWVNFPTDLPVWIDDAAATLDRLNGGTE